MAIKDFINRWKRSQHKKREERKKIDEGFRVKDEDKEE